MIVAFICLPLIEAGSPVLVVDDNRDTADSLAIILHRLGVNARVVYDGFAALEALANLWPALVLLDIGMPGMDGYEVIRLTRLQPEHNDVVLVAVTGWGQEADRRRSIAAGFDHHLVKPVDLAQIQALLGSSATNPTAQDMPTSVRPS